MNLIEAKNTFRRAVFNSYREVEYDGLEDEEVYEVCFDDMLLLNAIQKDETLQQALLVLMGKVND
jgi:hypothetical protein